MPYACFPVLAVVLCAASSLAVADPLDLAALTCASDAGVSARWKELERAGRRAGDGNFVLDGPFTFESLCVERVSVTAAFGALVVVGSVCDAKPEPLLAFVRRDPTLQPSKRIPSATATATAGVIAAYESPKRSFALYQGRVDASTAPDPKSRELSYTCSYRAGGAQ